VTQSAAGAAAAVEAFAASWRCSRARGVLCGDASRIRDQIAEYRQAEPNTSC
jgi:hypothetical protein